MLRGNEVPDKSLQQTVNRRLDRTGSGGQSRVVATVQSGMVTLAGTLQYENQRKPITRAIGNIQGVRRVIDQLQVVARKRTQ